MTDERWARMWEIFHDVRDLAGDERTAALERACGNDAELRREIERYLDEYDAPTTALGRDESPATDDLNVGDLVGPYRIVRAIGEGGMGVVYRAEQLEPVRRTVALKLIRPGMASKEVLARFEAERRALAVMEHENVARVFDAGATEQGRPYFAMEHVAGPSLVTYCDDRKLSVRDRLALFAAVCSGVEHAHRRGIIHRDLKPSNVLVTTVDGKPVPKIIDFGVARATSRHFADRSLFTEVGRLVGTPEYMSPEQAGLTGEDIDTRTDVYALGVLLYELLTGVRPFDSTSLRNAGYAEMLRIIREIDPPRPSTRISSLGADVSTVAERRSLAGTELERRLRGDLDCIVMKALEKDRERRYGSPGALAEDLERLRTNRPIVARPPSWGYRGAKFVRRNRVAVAAAVVVSVALVAGVATGAVGLVRARAAEREARAAEAEAVREARVNEEVSTFLTELFEVSKPGPRAADSLSAREILDRGAEKIRGSLEDEPEVRARVLGTLGEVYSRLGDYDRASGLFEEALEIRRELEPIPGHGTAWVLNQLGGVAFEAGNPRQAVEYYRRALEIDEREEGPDGPSTLTIVGNLGQALEQLGDYDAAIPVLRRAAEGLSEHYGGEHVRAGEALQSLSHALGQSGERSEAVEIGRRALAVLEAGHEDDDHPRVQYARNNLAILLWQEKRFEEARPVFEGVLDSVRRTHGDDHPYTARAMANLGLLLIELEQYAEARALTETALAVQERQLEANHPGIAATVLNLARLNLESGHPGDAEPQYRRGIRIRETVFGPEHRSLAGPLRGHAKALRALGREAEADREQARADAIDPEKG